MELEAACTAVDELKSSMEKLTAEYKAKSEISERWKGAHDENLRKFKELKMETNRQALELNTKSEEIYLAKKMFEDLKSRFHEKESVVKCLASANDKLKSSSAEKLQKLEGQNMELASAFDASNDKVESQAKIISEHNREIAELRGRLVDSKKKCSELEAKVQVTKELNAREEVMLGLEQENQKVAGQLKWKKEQFKHLEEAYEKHKDQFKTCKKEWEVERSGMVDTINSLEVKLESNIRIAEDLGSRMQMLNQVLAREETRRKMLEIQVSECKESYENVVAEFETLTEKRDVEIAEVRNMLASKDGLLKEMTFCNTQLQQEKDELQASLKEFQVAQINEAGAAISLKSLRQKFRNLELTHKDCLANLKTKEAGWSLRLENLERDLNESLCKLNFKEKSVCELQCELEDNHSSMMQLKLKYEEMSIMLMIFQSAVSESGIKSLNYGNDVNGNGLELTYWRTIAEEANKFKLDAATEMKRLQDECKHVRREIEALVFAKMRLEADFEKQELEFSQALELKDKKTESLQKELQIKLSLETDYGKEKLNYAREIEHKDKNIESLQNEIDAKLRLETDFEKERLNFAQEIELKDRKIEDLEKEIGANLSLETDFEKERLNFAQEIELKDRKIEDLQKEICANLSLETDFEKERLNFAQEIELKDRKIEDLQKEIGAKLSLETDYEKEKLNYANEIELKDKNIESLQKEIGAKLSLETDFEKEKLKFAQEIELKDRKIEDLHKEIEHQKSFVQQQSNIVAHVKSVATLAFGKDCQFCEEILATHFVDNVEKEFRGMVIQELEEEHGILKLKLQEEKKQFSDSMECLMKLEDEMESEKLDRNKEIARLGGDFERMQSIARDLENQIDELKIRSKETQESYNLLLSEREDQIMELCGMIGSFYTNNEALTKWAKHLAEKPENTKLYKGEANFSVNQIEECRNLGYKGPPESRSPLKEINGHVSQP